MSYNLATCCVCGESENKWVKTDIAANQLWKLHIVGDRVYVLCRPPCAEVFKLNPLVYEDTYDSVTQWLETSTRCWTISELRAKNHLL